MKQIIKLAIAIGGLTLLAAPPLTAGINEGIEYKLVTPPVAPPEKGKAEVIEMFWYGCPHCYHFEPKLDNWKKTLPGNVDFKRIPAIFPGRPVWELHARAYYTAELLNVLDKVHKPLFDAIHKHRQNLNNVDVLANFFAQYGVDKQVFKDTFESFGVQMKVNIAKDLTRRYQVDGVPTMIVNGRYRTHGSIANGQDGILRVVNFLVDKDVKANK